MRSYQEIQDAITRVLEADTDNFVELTKLAGLDPATSFRHANLTGVDFSGLDLSGFDFYGSDVSSCRFDGTQLSNAVFTKSIRDVSALRKAIDWEVHSKLISLRKIPKNSETVNNTEKEQVFSDDLWQMELPFGETIQGENSPEVIISQIDNKLKRGLLLDAEKIFQFYLFKKNRSHFNNSEFLVNLYIKGSEIFALRNSFGKEESFLRQALKLCLDQVPANEVLIAKIYDKIASNSVSRSWLTYTKWVSPQVLESAMAHDSSQRALGSNHLNNPIFYESKPAKPKAKAIVWLKNAEHIYKKALDIRERLLDPDHLDIATSHNNLAVTLEARGQFKDASLFYEKVLEIRERMLGPNHIDTAKIYYDVASNLDVQGRPVEAEAFYYKALEIFERVVGPHHPDTASSYYNVAMNFEAQGRAVEAEAIYRKALNILRLALGPNHPRTKSLVTYLKQFCDRISEPEGAT